MITAAFLFVAQATGSWSDVQVNSGNRQFEAEIRKAAGQERVDDSIARWRLEVFETPRDSASKPVWSCIVPHRPGERSYWLTDDGATFVALESEFNESRPLLRAWRVGERLIEASAAQLSLDRMSARDAKDSSAAWIAGEAQAPALEWLETSRGPTQFLHLTTRANAQRWVALDSGEVRTVREAHEPLTVEPPASRLEKPGLRASTIRDVFAPSALFWGETLEVRVHGAHPTPNWLFVGFEVTLGGADGHELELTAVSAPPPKNSVQAQVLVEFEATARIRGLEPGTYTLRVVGHETDERAPTLEVRFAKPALELHRRGGFAGLDQELRLYPNGTAVLRWLKPQRTDATSYTVARAAVLRRIADLVAIVEAPRAERGTVSDAFACELTIYDRETPRTLRFSDPGASGALLELSSALQRLFE